MAQEHAAGQGSGGLTAEGTLSYRTWTISGTIEKLRRMLLESVPESLAEDVTEEELSSGLLTEERTGLACQIRRDAGGEITSVYYTETDETGGLTENTLEFLPGGNVRLTRSGALSADFDFCPGERSLTTMVTPYGNVQLSLMTTEVTIKKDPERVSVIIFYHFIEAHEEIHRVEYLIEDNGQ